MIDETGAIRGLQSSRDRILLSLDFWSVTQEEIAIPAAPASQAMPDVIVSGLPVGVVIVRVIAMFKFRTVENSNAAVNGLDGAQHIQVRTAAPGAFADSISLPTAIFALAGNTRETGDVLIGDHNISATVTANDTYNFQWTDAHALQASLLYNDCQTGLRIWYSV
jgi:hypothetical protein